MIAALALALVGSAFVFVGGYIAGTGHKAVDNDSYWLGFADGELHGRLAERTPNSN